jgi:putative addiction module antidote
MAIVRFITDVIIGSGDIAMKIKITTVGNSAGIVLPKELLARLRIGKGDTLYATELPDGIKLTPFDPKLAGQMEVAEGVMRKRRSLLRKLAGS